MSDYKKTQWHPPFCADSIKSDDITVSLVHEGVPKKLIKWFKNSGCDVVEKYPGIYYVVGDSSLFPTQIIVSHKLDDEEHQWLKSLTSKMKREVGERLVLSANSLSDKEDKENADSVLQLALAENPKLFEELKEVPEMCEALTSLMKPEIDAAWNDGNTAGITKGATELATAIRRLNSGDTADKLIKEGFSKDIVKSAKELIDEL